MKKKKPIRMAMNSKTNQKKRKKSRKRISAQKKNEFQECLVLQRGDTKFLISSKTNKPIEK